ncbi:MAG: site-specific DNA-methyltransferase [Acidimicrobiaceae bacterium]|nr:site-specific DNA-methyltransferase [Acidimicrobiaceae bacterium]
MANEGRLELTWTNKHRTLLSGRDGSYEWVDPFDARVVETRLLEEEAAVGSPGDADYSSLLIRGDSLHALRSLRRLPEYATQFAGRIKLIYIDPPFNTGQAFSSYDDALEHSVWLTMMRDRLVELKRLLAPNGSIWVHLDDSEVHRLRCVMDEVFGASRFVATVIWQKRYSRDNRPAIGSVHDSILVYVPLGGSWKHHRNRVPRSEAKQYRNPNKDPRGPWRPIPMTAQGYRVNQMYEIVSPAGVVHRPSKGRCWSMIRERFDDLLAEGRIYFGKDGRGQPNVIRYLDEDEGLVPWTWWPAAEVGDNDESKKEMLSLFPSVEAFETPKPERLMQRIIHIATNPGDIVLDCFAGSGTTAAVAQKMGRRWLAIERAQSTVDTFLYPRLRSVVDGEDAGGVTEAVGCGGGFRVLSVADSIYEIDEAGRLFLSPHVTNGLFAEAVRAQLAFASDDDPPFCGRQGRARLAVVDGVAGELEVRHLVAALGAGERMVLVAKGIDAAVESLLAELSPGSRIRKAPRDLLRSSGRVTW